jgi:ABC-type tungstate transport system permease subunit
MKNNVRLIAAAAIISPMLMSSACRKKPPAPIDVGATPAVAESGLVQALVTTFMRQSGVKLHLRILPEEQLLPLARSGAVQVIFTSSPAASAEYASVARLSSSFAFHDFVLFGPSRDPARIHAATTAADALRRVGKRGARFCSAVDVPRIAARERQLWAAAGIDSGSLRRGTECRGDTLIALREADRSSAYTLSESQAAAASGADLDLKPLLEWSPDLHDSYSVILVDHAPLIRRDRDAEWFVQWITSYQGRDVVQNFRVDGVQLFSLRDARGKR